MAQNLTSALPKMGYQVAALRSGVYLLKSFHGADGALSFFGAGLFYSPVPLSRADTLYFYEFDAAGLRNDPEALNRYLDRLADLDASHLDDPANQPIPVAFTREVFGDIVHDMTFIDRAEPGRQRPVGITSSGDVICYR